MLDFAEQAAIALENARLLAELRRRERQVEALNRRLEVELAARREELSGIKQELRDNREALAVRYDYRNIIGRTPRMLELFRLLDRITDTTLPVVIAGESGTGKELVARAIHVNGPRRDRPFVGENCAAIPETLLESTLFGYVRGAFTGAEHDTRGLFEVADGGTLFLDEVGRDVARRCRASCCACCRRGSCGGSGASARARSTCASWPRATAICRGWSRRGSSAAISSSGSTSPRSRCRRCASGATTSRSWSSTSWPSAPPLAGRPARPKPWSRRRSRGSSPTAGPATCASSRTRSPAPRRSRAIASRVADLSPQVAAAGDPGALEAADPDSLLLRPRVERLERSLLREALGRAGNNQTKAADLLGLSRFGLQKKLKRYNFA